MMRLVFLFSAEERGLLLLGDPLYDEHYAVSTLGEPSFRKPADQHGEEVLERRHDAWVPAARDLPGRLRRRAARAAQAAALRRAPVRSRPLPVPRRAQAGDDLERHARPTPLPINNRTVLHLLERSTLSTLERRTGEARRLSFRALDIEQIGHVYEGLLDHTAKRATEPMLGLTGAKGDEPEVAAGRSWNGSGPRARTNCVEFLKERDGPVGERAQESADDELDRRGRCQPAPRRLRRRRGPVQPGAALRGAGPARHVRLSGRDPQRAASSSRRGPTGGPAARTTRPAA